jgi:putative inorganic carbon (HCO3(-)) transporter
LFLVVILVSCALAVYPSVSWAHWFDFVGWFIVYFLIINIVNTPQRFFIFLGIFLLASFKLSFFGARTWALRGFSFTTWGLMGPSGHFQNSGELALQMLMFAPISYFLAEFFRPTVSKFKYFMLLLVPVTAVFTVIGAGSRGAQLAMVFQAFRVMIKGKVSLKKLVLIALVGFAGYAMVPEQMLARFQSAGEDQTSQQRLLYWKGGLKMIEEHPALGVGFYNFAPYFTEHYPQDLLFGAAQLPHNIFVQVGTDVGIIGLLIFLAILVRNFRVCMAIEKLAPRDDPTGRFARAVAAGLSVALWGFILAGQFVTVTYYPFLWINLAMSVALLNITRQQVALRQSQAAPPANGAPGVPR